MPEYLPDDWGSEAFSQQVVQLRIPVHIRAVIEVAAGQEGVSINEWMLDAIRSHLRRRRSLPFAATAVQLYTDRCKVGIRIEPALRDRVRVATRKRDVTQTVWILDAFMSKLGA